MKQLIGSKQAGSKLLFKQRHSASACTCLRSSCWKWKKLKMCMWSFQEKSFSNRNIFLWQIRDYGNFGLVLGENTNFLKIKFRCWIFSNSAFSSAFLLPLIQSFSIIHSGLKLVCSILIALCYKTENFKIKIIICNKKPDRLITVLH